MNKNKQIGNFFSTAPYKTFLLLRHFDEYRYKIIVNLVNQTPIYVGYDVVIEMPYCLEKFEKIHKKVLFISFYRFKY